jgi:putative ABC transport system permease protein
VALVGHGLWVRRYGEDPAAIGRTIVIDARTSERVSIAGVLPAEFEMPLGTADILLPAQIRPLAPQQPMIRFLTAFARLKPGVTPRAAESALAPQLSDFVAITPPPGGSASWRVRPLRDRQVGDAARVAWLLLGAVAVFLLIACVNVANLMLARVAARRREFAVRAAIGGGRLRLARLALCESLLLSLGAGALGLLVALGLLETFVAMAPAGIPKIADASLDLRVFAVAILLAAVTGVAIGLWPAFSVFHIGGLQALRSTGASPAGTRPRARFGLVTAQIALTVALLGGSALLLRSV